MSSPTSPTPKPATPKLATPNSSTMLSKMTGKRFVHVFIVLMLLCLTSTPTQVWAAPAQQDADIVDTAAANADFSTLVAAIQAAGLADSLKSGGPYTIFAPTNDAFDALSGRLEALLADPAGDLTQILLYHVVSGVVTSEDITDGMQLTTLQGGTIQLTVTGDAVQANAANVVSTDIEASNGVIHVIDMVLTPPSADEMADEETAAEETEAETETAAPEATEEATPEATPEATEEAADETMEVPSVAVVDQESEGAQVLVPSAYSEGPGWMVIHADVDGRPGPVLGQTAVAPGANNSIVVLLNQPASGETTLWAMLHIDAGQVGVYEFPGPDVPAEVEDAIVMASFVVNAPAATGDTEAAEAETADTEAESEAAESTEESAEESMEEDTEAETVVPEPTEAAPAQPAQMPTTGGTLPAGVSIGVVAAVVTLLAGAAFVTRRRTV